MQNIDKLLQTMAALRDPQRGCPWDIEQDFASIAPYTIEEAYEVADAIERGDMDELRCELGDLLLQVVFHSQMASEQQLFSFDDVAEAISTKLIRRHPHVFSDAEAGTAKEQHQAWEAHKAEERRASGNSSGGALAGLTMNLPALTLAAKTSKKAAATGFDWDNADQVVDKIHEELDELKEARERGDQANTEEELGDLLLAVTNLARHLNVNPEQALHNANRKFINRFEKLEGLLQSAGESWDELSLGEMEARWQTIKLNDGSLSDRAKPV
jgi:MazG family protein